MSQKNSNQFFSFFVFHCVCCSQTERTGETRVHRPEKSPRRFFFSRSFFFFFTFSSKHLLCVDSPSFRLPCVRPFLVWVTREIFIEKQMKMIFYFFFVLFCRRRRCFSFMDNDEKKLIGHDNGTLTFLFNLKNSNK
jgi:hypothetical protein